jgi:hypothetical protein
MKIEDHVCTFEQAKKLKEFGILNESPSLYFMPTGDIYMIVSTRDEWIPAFTVAELSQMLPDYYLSWRFEETRSGKKLWIATAIAAPKPPGIDDIHTVHEFDRFGHTQAEALATLLISLLNCEVITIQEVNRRLTQ